MNVLKIIGIALCVLIGWWVINLTVAYWWAMTTAATEPMGTTEFFLREVLRNVPAIGYFLVVGVLLALTMGVATGAASALLAAIANLCINVALETHTILVTISYFEAAILLINYGSPVAAAAVGAMLVQLMGKRTLVET
jgi:hypothetical protein